MFKKIKGQLVSVAANTKAKAYALGSTAMVATGSAMAGGGTGPDLSAVEAVFDEYKVAVVALIIAFAVVLWSIRAAGLAKPK